jgi:penicillin amidase
MRTWLKITLTIFISILVIFIIGGYVMYRMLNTSLPVYEGEIKTDNIKNEIKIYRDSMAVPDIIAQSDEDAAFALGFLHAQERMFVMDIIRRAGEGRLSEILGEETVPFDMMFRTIGIKRTAELIEKKMKPDMLKLLAAYSAGINLYINESKNRLTFEFDILGYQPEEWKPIHSVIIVRMMAWELNLSWWTDLAFTELVQKLGEEKVKEILPSFPENAPLIIPSEIKKFADVQRSFIETDKAFRKFVGMTGTHLGSNNWVVNSEKSKSGKPIIANDPHLAFSAPGKWYAAVIKSPEWNAAGVTLPGVPGVVIGKNENISWTLTNIMTDDADFYYETLDSARTHYLVDDKWRELRIIDDTIAVKDTDGMPFQIKITHRGPIISSIHPYTFIYNDEQRNFPAMSFRWIGNEVSDELEAFIRINKSKNWNEFKSSVQKFNVPGQNFVYADADGNIGYIFGGSLPLRESNSPTFVLDGSTSEADWKGFVNKNELPLLFNPDKNYIATANNKVIKEFKHHISNLWEPPSRIKRITELLDSTQKHSSEDFMKYQMDIISPYAKQLVPYILNAFEGIEITDANLKHSLELIEKWNFEMHKFSQAPAIYLIFFDKLLNNTYRDEMGNDLYNQYVFLANVPYRNILELLASPDSSWFDDVSTTSVETRDEIIRKSLADALTWLEEKLGKEIKNWQWGSLHKVTFKHPFSGNAGLLDKLINIGPYEISGDGTTICNTEYSFSESIEKFSLFRHEQFENELGPSMRFIYDFAKPDEFYLILTTGQSGNVLSDHYRDMTLMWVSGKFMKVRTDENSILNTSNNLLILSPN